MPTRIFIIILTCCLLAAAVSAQNRGSGAQGRKPDSAATSRDSRNDHQTPVKWWTDDKIRGNSDLPPGRSRNSRPPLKYQ